MNVNVHIERLVLEGLDVSPRDGDTIGMAVQRELTRLIGMDSPSLSQGFSVPSVRAAPLTLNAHAGAQIVAKGVARSIYGELTPGSETESGASVGGEPT